MANPITRWTAGFLLLCGLGMPCGAFAENVPLIDLSALDAGVVIQDHGGTAQVLSAEQGNVLAVTAGGRGGDYPAVHLHSPSGKWNLSGATAVIFELQNPSDQTLRVHGRVDNAGDWRKQPWSVNAVTLKPGAAAKLTVPFGKHYGNPAYALDPAAVSQIVLFVERPKGEVTLHVRSITATESGTPASSIVSTNVSANAAAGVVPKGNTLYDFEGALDESLLQPTSADYRIVAGTTGKALEVMVKPTEAYPGIQLNAPGPGGAWDLSNFAGVELRVCNTGAAAASVVLRIDNPGDWRKNPWNAEKAHLKPGESKLIRVKFGQSWGGAGYALNPAAVVRALVFIEYPKQEVTLQLDNLAAYGQATQSEVDTVDLKGLLFDFGSDFVLAHRVDERGASVALADGRLVVTFSANERWPAAALKPVARRWDLSNFKSVSAQVTNVGDEPARIAMRVDNLGADGQRNCNTEALTLVPGQTQNLTVTFGQSWGKPAFALDSANVVAILFITEDPRSQVKLAIDNVIAQRKDHADRPDWIGRRPPVEGDWVQTLDENFDGPALNEKVWTPRMVWDGPAAAETQRYRQDNVRIEDGKLVILCEKNPGHQYDDPKLPTRDYATGAVTSLDKWTQAYGYFEARIKRPSARGLWPAFWMMPDRGPGHGDIWARRSTHHGGMEIDIWEHLTEWGPNRYNAAAHWDGYEADHKQWGNSGLHHLPNPDGWNNFGLLWEPGKLTWYCDGKKMVQWQSDRISSLPNFLKFTVQMGNWATRDVDDAALPDRFEVDYVRAWQLRSRLP
jgi:beta-glucanase (GH16 family)/uncharacterized cupredoxin-like copper-binding protein